MKPTTILAASLFLLLCSCEINKTDSDAKSSENKDSITLVNMVKEREFAMKNKDIPSVMSQFSDDATFINSAGYYLANKKEIENFHDNLLHMDSSAYHYKAGKVHVRFIDEKNALVYYPWRMDWYKIPDADDTVFEEVGLMTLTAQLRNEKWQWIAITNQHTKEYFEDLTKHK
jgi:hypothetical protein